MSDRSLPCSAAKRRWTGWILLAGGLLVLALTACSAQSAAKTANLGGQVALAPGQDVLVIGEPLRIEFAAVISDSRCPSGATCIWQGEASCRLKITYKNTVNTKIITEPGLSSQPTTTEFAGYEFQFQLQPYPQAGKDIDKNAYVLQLTVDRKAASTD